MNKESRKKSFWKGRVKDLIIMGVLAVVLFYASWKIFQGEEEKNTLSLSENEVKVMRLLQEIDGVGEASVIVYEDGEEVKSVVVVCEGANDLRVAMNVREAVAAALNTQEKAVKIYLKKE